VHKISSGICQWKNFGNRSTFANVIIETQVYHLFSETQCTCIIIKSSTIVQWEHDVLSHMSHWQLNLRPIHTAATEMNWDDLVLNMLRITNCRFSSSLMRRDIKVSCLCYKQNLDDWMLLITLHIYCSASTLLSMQTITADGHKCLASQGVWTGWWSNFTYLTCIWRPVRGRTIVISSRSLESENQSPCAIVQHCLHDDTFSCSGITLTCDRHTDG